MTNTNANLGLHTTWREPLLFDLLKARFEDLWEEPDFRGFQSGQLAVFSGAYTIAVLQCICTWLLM